MGASCSPFDRHLDDGLRLDSGLLDWGRRLYSTMVTYIRAILDAVLASEFGRSRGVSDLSATTSPWLRAAVGLRILQEARGRPLGLT